MLTIHEVLYRPYFFGNYAKLIQDKVPRGWGTVMGPLHVSSRNKGHELTSGQASVDCSATMEQTDDRPKEGCRSVALSHRLSIGAWLLLTSSAIK